MHAYKLRYDTVIHTVVYWSSVCLPWDEVSSPETIIFQRQPIKSRRHVVRSIFRIVQVTILIIIL